ncbi:rna-directed dna polymerase from mobile element jockey-like [Pitangus sulphuratus]|nr:rna-directed dna polymerase from mobile element jockey-like [Pitangus sulphuratus]
MHPNKDRHDRLERLACANLVKFIKAKCKVLHMDWGNPKHKYRPGEKGIESSPEKNNLGVLIEHDPAMCTGTESQMGPWTPSKETWPAGQGS